MKTYSAFTLALALGIGLCWLLPVTAQVVLYQQDFDAATPGQSLTAPPLGWSTIEGDVKVSGASHPGWTGNAVIGGLSSYPWGWVQLPMPGLPNNGVVKFTFDAWAPYTISGAEIGLLNNKGEPITLNPWDQIPSPGGRVNDWAFDVPDGRVWVSPPNFMREVTVRASIVVDFEVHKTWAELDDGTTSVTTTAWDLPVDLQLTGLYMFEDHRWGSVGADFDNLKLGWTGVPEPLESAGVAGVAALAFAMWRRRGSV